MKLHEYQAKDVFRSFGIPVPPGRVATTAGEAGEIAREYGRPVVVKAQVHVGGRGKAGGVKLAQDPAEARARAQAILGMDIKGLTVRRVLITPAEEIASEAYAAVILDRAARCATFMVSRAGGVDIEQVAAETPELIVRLSVDPRYGLLEHQALGLGLALYDDLRQARAAAGIFGALWRVFLERDASLAEINPLVITKDGKLIALDAKFNFDDNALFRHKELAELRDLSEEDPAEVRAANAGLSYVQLEGNIGCLVNGAGLAMSTMDLIKLHGGEPANFLDVGGGANTEQVTEAFRILLGDKNVKAVLVNIFGGIMRCTTIANAILEAYKQVDFNVPLVVRLEGTEVEEGRKILAGSGIKVINAEGLTDAAKKVVAAAKVA